MPDDGPQGPKYVASIKDIIKKVCCVYIYLSFEMSQHNGMKSNKF